MTCLALSSAGFALGVLRVNHAGLLPGRGLSKQRIAVLSGLVGLAAILGAVGLVLAAVGAREPALLSLAAAGVAAIVAGAVALMESG